MASIFIPVYCFCGSLQFTREKISWYPTLPASRTPGNPPPHPDDAPSPPAPSPPSRPSTVPASDSLAESGATVEEWESPAAAPKEKRAAK